MRIGEVARTLGLSASRVRQLADDGTIPTRRTSGGHRLFDLAAVRQAQTMRWLSHQSSQRPDERPSWKETVSLPETDEAEVWRAISDGLDLADVPARAIVQYAFTR